MNHPSKPSLEGPNVRPRLIAMLREHLERLDCVRAAWLGGSEANGRTDRWSDIDLVIIVEDDAVDRTIDACKAAVSKLAPIALELRLPMPTWHGHDQVFLQLEGVPDWCMVDLVVIQRSSKAPRFLECERHGTPVVLLDRDGLVVPEPFDRAAHEARMKDRLHAMAARFQLLQHLVRKAVWRNDPADAADKYMTFTLRPLVELLRMRHCPDRFDFGMRYLRDDLPEPAWRMVEELALPGDLQTLLAAQQRAEAAFERELSMLV